MTILRALAAAVRLDASVREGIEVTRRKVAVVVAVALTTLAFIMMAALWLAAALFLWLSPELGQAGAAAVTGAVFAALALIAILIVGGQIGTPLTAAPDAAPPGDLVSMLEEGVRKESERAPKPLWDLAAMLAVGVVAGLSAEKRRP